MDALLQDLRYGLRTLMRNPGFTLVAVMTLALGIGVNTTLFSAYNAVALKALPVADAGRVVRLKSWFKSGALGDPQFAYSYGEFLDVRDHSRSFSHLIAVSWPLQVLGVLPGGNATDPQLLRGQLVSRNYFTALGVQPAMGRAFTAAEDQAPGANPVVVLSHAFWQRTFGDSRVLGQTLKLNGTAFTVIGVASAEFIGTGNPPTVPDFWTPLSMQAQIDPSQDWLHMRAARQVQILGRLKPDLAVSQAQAETEALALRMDRQLPEQDRMIRLTLQQATFFGDTDDGRFQAFVALLMGIVGLVLLIACANLANMLLARASHRQKEIGVRHALGAGRARLIRQLLTESVLLAAMGGIAAMILSIWASSLLWLFTQKVIEGVLGSRSELALRTTPDFRVFLYTLLISVFTGVVFGLWPALQTARTDLTGALKSEVAAFGQRLSRSRLRTVLVAGQVAVSLVLLISAGLLVRGVWNAELAQTGFETRKVYLLSSHGKPSRSRVIEQLQAVPEVSSVALVEYMPMMGTHTAPMKVEGTRAAPETLPDTILCNSVSPSYFETLGIPIVRGNNFSDPDAEREAPVIIVSETTARKLWPGEDPIGKTLRMVLKRDGEFSEPLQVIGVAKDVRTANLSRVDPGYVYQPMGLKGTRPAGPLLVRMEGDPQHAAGAVRAALATLDPGLVPRLWMTSMENGPMKVQRLMTESSATFATTLAFLALLLALAGIYGVVSYDVSQRTQEIGIRMALGAGRRDVMRMVLRQAMIPVLAGAVPGLAAAGAVGSLVLASLQIPGAPDLLFGVHPFDPLTLCVMLGFLTVVALLASYIPARRAMRVDPMVALRYE